MILLNAGGRPHISVTASRAAPLWERDQTSRPHVPPLDLQTSARLGSREGNACPESLLAVAFGETFRFPTREKPRVRAAVMAHGQCPPAQVDNLHRVRMTALPVGPVIMVAPVRRLGSTRRHLGQLRQISYLVHDLLPSSFIRRGRVTAASRDDQRRHVGHVAASG
jgi:hypothetical protein